MLNVTTHIYDTWGSIKSVGVNFELFKDIQDLYKGWKRTELGVLGH